MDWKNLPEEDRRLFDPENFHIKDLKDEIQADELCVNLLRIFIREKKEAGELNAHEAGALASGADYFLRDFIISDRRENIFKVDAFRIRQFAGNWYIVKNMQPNLPELKAILMGVEAFYDFCTRAGRMEQERFDGIRRECRRLEYFAERIEKFWAIEGAGFFEWERECSLRIPTRDGKE